MLSLPFTGRWLVQNSPARRIPSHGTDLGRALRHRFVGVDDRNRTARVRDWRTILATEPPDRFVGFGRPVLAPADGVVVGVHDGEIDHVGRRSQLSLIRYVLGQRSRLRKGIGAIAGNHLIITLPDAGVFVALVHLQAGSLCVAVGEEVTTGQPIADCGNSGNSTEPHLHVQVMDDADQSVARGVPMSFRHFRERARGARHPVIRRTGIPGEGAVVEPVTAATVEGS